MHAPVVIFCYRRSIKKLLASLYENSGFSNHRVYIFSDGWKSEKDKDDVLNVRSELKKVCIDPRFAVFEASINKGLANSIIDGVGYVITSHGNAIVLEDDLIVSPYFLRYMNDALEAYKDDERVWSISGFSPPVFDDEKSDADVFLFPRGSSWGWATWKDRWDDVDWEVKSFEDLKKDRRKITEFEKGGNDLFKMLELQMLGKIDSWAIRWCFSQYLNGQYTIYPYKTLINNLGFEDGYGVHNSGGVNIIGRLIEDKGIDVSKTSSSIGSEYRLVKRFYDLSLTTRIGYFLRKHGGHSFAKNIYSRMR